MTTRNIHAPRHRVNQWCRKPMTPRGRVPGRALTVPAGPPYDQDHGALAALHPPRPLFVRVVGVANDDVLNVRRGPDHRQEPVGTIAPDARCLSLLWRRKEARWWRIAASDRVEGWVNRRFLRIQPRRDCPTVAADPL